MFTVIIPTCHRNDLLSHCLDCLAPGKQTLAAENYEVIVSDDGSASTALELIEKHYPWAKWLEGPKRGPAANRNHGAKHARGEWLVFTDDDCIPGCALLQSYADATAITKVEVLEGKTSPIGKRRRVDMECPANEAGGYLWSCNMAVLKGLFFKMDGFDENFPGAAMEDVDFHTRLLKAKTPIAFVPEALVLHPWRDRKRTRQIEIEISSTIYYLQKHPEERGKYSLSNLGLGLARRLLSHLPRAAMHCKGRGWIRESLFSIYSTWTLFQAVKSSKL